ncbi:MAG: slipin family protein [Desulfobacula sp.]|jgi:regulator of protease activity HflC (stomatin/prohibitin superfamily)|nr:slipin family protein [Desulfobacula sp.]
MKTDWNDDQWEKVKWFNPFSIMVFIIFGSIFIAIGILGYIDYIWVIAGGIISLFLASCIQVADQWEKAVLLRLGKFIGLRGPGLFFIIPIIDRVDSFIDQRVRVTDFSAEQTLTKDTVPVNVDAVVYWTVWDAEKAALEVRKYIKAVTYVAMTSLRDIIGKHELADILKNRDKIAKELQQIMDEHTNPWGISCQTVGIKDIVIPTALSDAMSKQAQAERERQARIILGTAETEIAEKFALAAEQYRDNPIALQLRGMNMLFEGLKEKGSLIIVPSSALESMNLGTIGGLAALSDQNTKTDKKEMASEN